MAVQAYINKNGKKTYRKVDMNVYNSLVIPMNTDQGGVQFEDKGQTTPQSRILSTKVRYLLNQLNWLWKN